MTAKEYIIIKYVSTSPNSSQQVIEVDATNLKIILMKDSTAWPQELAFKQWNEHIVINIGKCYNT